MCAKFFKRILVGIDGEGASNRPVQLAAQLASAFSSEVMLVHVTQLPVMMPPDLQPILANVQDAMKESARRLLESVSRPLAPDVPSQCIVDEGNPAWKILQAAAEWHADLIILGARGYGRLGHFIAGSTGQAVIHRATCPVLICPQGCTEQLNESINRDQHNVREAYAQ